jgi:DNA-binding SARP family transcriptional activator
VPGDGSPLHFELLGPLRAVRGGAELDLGPAKQRAVLAVLLLEAGRAVPTSRIVDAVWGDEPPENGPNVVQKYVAGLRRVLDPDRSPRTPGALLALAGGGYRLAVGPEALDIGVFRAAVTRAAADRDAGRPAEAAAALRTALALWHGPALAGLAGPVFDAARTRLTEEHVGAWEAWAEAELGAGNAGPVVGELVRLIGEFPTREGLRALLMTALHATGRQAEALEVFLEARRYLAEEFGVEPGERLRETHRRILQGTVDQPAPPSALQLYAAPPSDPQPYTAPPSGPQPYAPQHYAPRPYAAPAGAAPMPARKRDAPEPWPVSMPGAPTTWLYHPPRAHRAGPEIVAATVLPVVTCTLGSWIYFLYAGVRRRDWRLLVLSAGYVVAVAALFALIGTLADDNGDTTTTEDVVIWSALGFVVVSAAALGGFVATHLGDTPARRRAREHARMFVLTDPDGARRAGVGRPDLPRAYDDGGLVDLNHVPGHHLGRLRGIDARTAHAIVVDRMERGPYRLPEDLVARGMIAPEALHRIAGRLVCVPPATGEISGGRPR